MFTGSDGPSEADGRASGGDGAEAGLGAQQEAGDGQRWVPRIRCAVWV